MWDTLPVHGVRGVWVVLETVFPEHYRVLEPTANREGVSDHSPLNYNVKTRSVCRPVAMETGQSGD